MDLNASEITNLLDRLTDNEAASPTLPKRVQLSVLLATIPRVEQGVILENIHAAIGTGVVDGVALADQPSIKVIYHDSKGARVRRTIQDLLLQPTPAFESWLRERRQAARLRAMTLSGKIESTLERIETGEDDFGALADLTRRMFAPVPVQAPKQTKQGARK